MIKLGNNNIGKIYFGSNFIGKAYLGSNLVYQYGSAPGPGPEPPATNLSYLRGGGNGSYIDTGIKPDNTTKVVVWARNFNPGGSYYTWLFGSRSAYGTAGMVALALSTENETGKAMISFGESTYTNVGGFENYISNYHKYELDNSGLYVDDVKVASLSGASFSSNYNLYLFNDNSGGTAESTSPYAPPVDIIACKIYKNNVLVRDYSATNSPSVGLYDSVSDTVFTASGGTYTYGTFNSEAYTPLEYVSTNAASYFDSGIYGSDTLDYVGRFRLVAPTLSDWAWVFGCESPSTTKRYGITFGTTSNPGSQAVICFNTQSMVSSKPYNNVDTICIKSGVTHRLYKDNAQAFSQNATASTFSTDFHIYVGCDNNSGEHQSYFVGRIYHLRFGFQRNYVPALVDNTAGLYDTYNDVFYESDTATPFVAGPEL